MAVFGSIGLVVCYDMAGTRLWEIDVGVLQSGWFYDPDFQWGHSSSPIIHDNLVIIQADTPSSFIVAVDVETGREVWRVSREDEISTFATPTVYSGPGGDELITNGTQIRAYDPGTGELLWTLGPNSEIPIATPIIGDDLIYLTAGYLPIRPIYAVRPGHRGDLSLRDGVTASDALAWSKDRGGTYIPTPLVYRGYFYTKRQQRPSDVLRRRDGPNPLSQASRGGRRLLLCVARCGRRQAVLRKRGRRHLRCEGWPRLSAVSEEHDGGDRDGESGRLRRSDGHPDPQPRLRDR